MRTNIMRTGIRIKGERGNPEVKRAFIRFAVWLRTQYEFPIRVPVYLFPGEYIITMHGEKACASFFAPWDQTVEPFIRIATGDYPDLKKRMGRDDALSSMLCSFAHEVVHYRQWVETGDMTEKGVVRRSHRIVDAYAKTVDHP